MSEQDKKPDDAEEDKTTIDIVAGFLSDNFDKAVANTGEALDAVSREARNTLKAGEELAKEAYGLVESTIGKDRVIGGVVGAKAGGTVGMAGGIKGIFLVGAVGMAIGVIGGRRFVEWYNRKDEKDKANDNTSKPEEP